MLTILKGPEKMRIVSIAVIVLCAASKAAAGRCLTNLSQVSFTYNYPYGVPIPYRRYYRDNDRTVLNDGVMPTAIRRDPANSLSLGAGDHVLRTLCALTEGEALAPRPVYYVCSEFDRAVCYRSTQSTTTARSGREAVPCVHFALVHHANSLGKRGAELR